MYTHDSVGYGPVTPLAPTRRALLGVAASGLVLACALPSAYADWLDTVKEGLKYGAKLFQNNGTLRALALDVSISPQAEDAHTLYRAVAQQWLRTLEPGDTALLLPLGAAGQADVQIQKVTLERTGRAFDDKRLKAEVVKHLAPAVQTLLQQDAKRSRLIEGLAALRPEFALAQKTGSPVRLTLCSDQLEDSALARFDSPAFGEAQARALLRKLQAQQLLLRQPPAAKDSQAQPAPVPVHAVVVGAGGRTPEQYARVAAFWRSYFEAAQVALDYYGRTVPSTLA